MRIKMNRNDCQSYALWILRLVLGSVFFLHGAQKLFGWFGGPGMNGFINWIGTLGVNSFFAHLAAMAEFIGGCLMLLGIATELGALMISPVMIGAIYLVHLPHGYFIQNNGFEYTLNLILLALAVIIGGPGKGALWDPFIKFRSK